MATLFHSKSQTITLGLATHHHRRNVPIPAAFGELQSKRNYRNTLCSSAEIRVRLARPPTTL